MKASMTSFRALSLERFACALLMSALLCGGAFAQGSQTRIVGLVIDAQSGRPLQGINVLADDDAGTVTDRHGVFALSLPPGQRIVRLSAVGYGPQAKSIAVDADPSQGLVDTIRVSLTPRVIELADQIVIRATRDEPTAAHRAGHVMQTMKAIDAAQGVALVRRANFGLDPSIRGTQPHQVGVVIEAMKVFHACVDRMDPVTSYVETENLQRLEITRGAFDLTQGAAVGGMINLVTEKPSFDAAFSGHSQVGFESAASHRFSRNVFNLSRGDFALRSSISFRRAGDLTTGGRSRASGSPARVLIPNSQFAKYNYKVDVTRRGRHHHFELGLLADEAWDIGYPALLMDARRASSHLAHVEHIWAPDQPLLSSVRTKLYLSDVDHWMDDEDRDVTQRRVMRDMHMPMEGHARTWGLLQSAQLGSQRQTLRFVLDAYQVQAFADMEMISVRPDVTPMYLVNIGDARRRHLAITADYQRWLTPRLQARANARVDAADQDLHDTIGRQQMKATWGAQGPAHRFATPSLSLTLVYRRSPSSSWTFGLSRSARLPIPLESYGFFLFNPADNYFYTGRPDLDVERSRQLELGWDYAHDGRRLTLRLYDNRIYDYITGVVQESIFKTYENIDAARLRGIEVGFATPLAAGLIIHGDASYTYGRNESFDEPLPFVPPLEARVGITHESPRVLWGVNSRWVTRQDRVADQTTLEDETPAFSLVDVRAEIRLWGHYRLDVGIDNLFDRYYWEHLSVGNFPSPGRNLRVGLEFGF